MTAISQLFKEAKSMGISCKQLGEPTKQAPMMMRTEERPEKRNWFGGRFSMRWTVHHEGITKEIAEQLASKTGLTLDFTSQGVVMHLFEK